jgi:molybdenum cofactor biosynthesis enzyme MoaA
MIQEGIHVKVNVVAMKGLNDDEINDFNFCFSVNGGANGHYFCKLTPSGKFKKDSCRKAIY